MSINITLPPTNQLSGPEDSELETSSEGTQEEETFSDWVDDEDAPTKSLFDETVLPNALKAVAYDKETHGVDVIELGSNLKLDFLKRVRLINYIRKSDSPPADILALKVDNPLFSDDAHLRPVIEDDPLLLLGNDEWSDDDEDKPGENKKIAEMEQELSKVRARFEDLGRRVPELLSESDYPQEPVASTSAEALPAKPRDDDTHYFDSYSYNEIHAVMIQDSVRTSSYATFILSNPQIFKDAVVMDVGCGTGILSMFAARAGARKVFAIEASGVGIKAQQNFKDNGYEDTITLIRGKVEIISLPEGYTHVDVIISEWMGYSLLYESMLDSVLFARDKFLRAGGLMAPSQCRIMANLVEVPSVIKENVTFWDNVYGFSMASMAKEVYDDALIEVVSADADIPIQRVTPKNLDFSSPFVLTSTRPGKAHALLLYFDTWFTTDGADVPPDAEPTIAKGEGDVITTDVLQIKARPELVARRKSSMGPLRKKSMSGEEMIKDGKEVSFSTGPASMPTHWKQTLFLFRNPVDLKEGTCVSGRLHMRKSEDNSRELDAEIHFKVQHPDLHTKELTPAKETVVQSYKIR
ncbi:protein arginine N-methyltransferase 3 [Rhizoctonia solani AG-1 IB]|uniref:type I protein arginine methyltransferase n=1 Tax=Thanatephorus cucumeris (strain AG1-IB / isolate 7/3/14) TaxID=1108050 RepID=M5CEC3_THACB|nr:protein arginine N-methyltransferase 3 [Rhizoctonia solani AG-1 IB]